MMRNDLFKGREKAVRVTYTSNTVYRADGWDEPLSQDSTSTVSALVCYGNSSVDPAVDLSMNGPSSSSVRVFARFSDLTKSNKDLGLDSIIPGDILEIGSDHYTIESVDYTRCLPGPYDVRIVAKKEVDDGV